MFRVKGMLDSVPLENLGKFQHDIYNFFNKRIIYQPFKLGLQDVIH